MQRRAAYANWADTRVARPLYDGNPVLFARMVENKKQMLLAAMLDLGENAS
jgi:Flp pilus assembly protein CpaB